MTGTATILRGNALTLPLADASVDLIVTTPCEARHSSGLRCSRPARHTRRHAAVGLFRVYAVWRQQ
jgi:hypothetical protein